ncbi:MAG: hypothetical protein AB1589_40090 [Cyanobacteriota bacterium]
MGLLGQEGDGQKPLARKYFNQLKKQGVAMEERKSPIESVRLSGSGEWIIIEAEDCSGLINAESKVGETFWSFCQTLHGKQLSGLEIFEAKGKIGFDIQPDLSRTGYWSFDSTEEKLEFGKKHTTGNAGLITLSIEAMTPKSVQDNGKIGDNAALPPPTSSSQSGNVPTVEKPSRSRSKAPQAPEKQQTDS